MAQTKTAKPTLLQPGDRFLTCEETAELLGTTANTLSYYRVAGGGPPFYRHGRSIRYLLSEISAYGLRNRVEPGENRRYA